MLILSSIPEDAPIAGLCVKLSSPTPPEAAAEAEAEADSDSGDGDDDGDESESSSLSVAINVDASVAIGTDKGNAVCLLVQLPPLLCLLEITIPLPLLSSKNLL